MDLESLDCRTKEGQDMQMSFVPCFDSQLALSLPLGKADGKKWVSGKREGTRGGEEKEGEDGRGGGEGGVRMEGGGEGGVKMGVREKEG